MWFLIFLIALGMLLVFIELLILPGFGAAGVPGCLLMLIGIGSAWWKFGFQTALTYTGITLVAVIPLAIIALSVMRTTPAGKAFILSATQNKEVGFQAPPSELADLVGKSGKALTPLRPAGVALIGGNRVDIVTQGEFVPAETEIEVIFVEGRRVVVRSLQ
jgi:membrane-bound serine protease (ClpP class)